MQDPQFNRPGIGNFGAVLPGYRPIWERRPDLFPDGMPTGPKQPSTGDQLGQMVGGIAGLGGAAYLGKKIPGWMASLTGIGGKEAATEAATTTASKGIGASLPAASSVVPIAGAGIGAALLGKGAYDLAKGDSGDPVSRAQLGITTGGLSELYRLGQDRIWGSGKDSRQQGRDDQRARMQEIGILDDNYNAFGVDLGKDGGFRFDDGSKVYEAYSGMEDGTGEIDEQTGQLIGALQGAGYLLGDRPDSSYATGMLINAVKRGEGDQTANIKSVYDKLGGYQAAFDRIGDAVNKGDLDLETGQAYHNALNQLYTEEERKASRPQQAGGTTGTSGFNPWSYFGMEGPPNFSFGGQ